MMNFDKNIMFWIMLSFSFACCEDLFETIVDFEIPPQESVIATTAILQSNFSTSEILLSYTVGLNESEPFQVIGDADIQLTTVNQTLVDWGINSASRYLSSPLDYNGLAGSIAEITVSADGYMTSSASIIVPDTPIVSKVYYGVRKSFDIDGLERDLLKVTIADKRNVKNFYGIEAFRVRTSQSDSMVVRDTSRFYLEPDGLVTEGGIPLIFSDATFDGRESVIRSELSGSRANQNDQVIVRVTAFTEAYFQYLRSRSLYYDAQGNPFAEPVDLYSNMKNGVGIFTISQVRDYVAEIDP